MVSSSHPAISSAGARVLADGGNAADAALAMAAMAWVALPGQCGIGGDAFALLAEPAGRVRAVSGSGFGPDGGTPERYAGLAHLPRHGADSVASPGAVAALAALHVMAATRSLADLWAPAARAARAGMPCTARTAGDIAEHAGRLGADPATARYLRDGRAPAVGTRLALPELAATIERLARDPADLYVGDLAQRAVGALVEHGAPFTGEEWAATGEVAPDEALTGEYAGHRIAVTPLPTPGWMVLDQLAMCAGALEGTPPLSARAIHWLAGAARLSFDDRHAHAGSDSTSWRPGADPAATARARARIRSGDLPGRLLAASGGDTTSMVAVDGEGRAVSLIESLAFTFGAGTAIPGSGVVLNNRLARGAYLIPGHPNEVRPRRRPLHTLNAWVVHDDRGRLRHVGNTPGGDGQVQWNAQILSHLLDHGADPQQAVDAPRFAVFPGSDAEDLGAEPHLKVEDRLGDDVVAELRALGDPVVTVGPWGAGGSAQVVSVDHEHGVLVGGSDSRQEGVALGS